MGGAGVVVSAVAITVKPAPPGQTCTHKSRHTPFRQPSNDPRWPAVNVRTLSVFLGEWIFFLCVFRTNT